YICKMYEQASGRSAMYCDEAEKMAKNMQQLNKVYERMLTAMTINMAPAMAAGFAAAGQQAAPDTAK
ncbi:MAG: gliding motility protein GldL, partial [Muribaculaceae bacterium]|nr:gliding motility protein GldL [Muribaculaceae bacterium]